MATDLLSALVCKVPDDADGKFTEPIPLVDSVLTKFRKLDTVFPDQQNNDSQLEDVGMDRAMVIPPFDGFKTQGIDRVSAIPIFDDFERISQAILFQPKDSWRLETK